MTELATQNRQAPQLVDQLRQMQPEISKALPKHLTGERFGRLAMTAIRQTPKLTQCNPASFFGAVLTAAALGLEPNVNGEAYLVPYGKECQLIVGYQGLVKLWWNHPQAKRLSSDVVYSNDNFRYSQGTTQYLEHEPAKGDRGQPVGVYAIAELSSGAMSFEYLTLDQVAALRGHSRKPDVRDPQMWWARKTAIKQVLKLMPKAVELMDALAVDERPGSMKMAQALRDGDVIPQTEPLPVTDEPVEGEVVQ